METKRARQESGYPYCLAFICFSPLQNDPHSAFCVFLKHTPSCGNSVLLGQDPEGTIVWPDLQEQCSSVT